MSKSIATMPVCIDCNKIIGGIHHFDESADPPGPRCSICELAQVERKLTRVRATLAAIRAALDNRGGFDYTN
ncbi:MAG TPA: hypothetical protein VM487_14235, partial [Phycisphaerae bacterium]|nr:hypothetical protein [Phycisphaerae bacterium]